MAWIESHQSLLHHKKTNRAVALLKVNRFKFIGHLHALWWWALDNAPNGRLGDLLPEEIADAAGWDVIKGNEFVDALVTVGFIDRAKNGSLALHDWKDYAGRFLDLKQARSEAGRKGGLKSGEKRRRADSNQGEANDEANDEAKRVLLQAKPPFAEAPTDLTSPHLTNQPEEEPGARRARLRGVLNFSDQQWRDLLAAFPGKGDIHARWQQWVDWVREREGERMPDDKYAAFYGWLGKRTQQKTSAPAAAGAR